MEEKHAGKKVSFEMNVVSTYQNNALERQCGEAVWIKETNPNERINNKEEYHQPGDVEVSYTKNDNHKALKNQSNKITQEIDTNMTKEKVTHDKNDEDQQRKITEFFIQKIREECENEESSKINDENDNTENDKTCDIENVISTQEIIEDARERRELKMKGKKEVINCEQCEFTSGSKTLLKRHIESYHRKQTKLSVQEMQKRYSCDTFYSNQHLMWF